MPSEPKDNTASHVLHRRTGVLPYTVLSGEGIYLNLNSGRRIIDGSGGAAVACLGHGRKDIADAIQRQLSSFAYAYSGANLTSHPAEELARLLLEDTYGEGSKAFFCNSGSEATEAALKLALQFWREKGCETRTQIVARRQGYHGNTLSALSVSGIDDRRKDYSSWMSPHVTFVERCFPYRGKATSESDQDYVRRLVEDLDNTFQRIGPQNIAAFIMETVSGTSLGCVPPPRGYLKEIAAVCKKHGIILILDEIMCGMGRIGALHAWQLEDFDGPDIQTIGKSLGGGFIPLSAVLVSRKVIEAVSLGSGRFSHSHTFQAHPLACAAAHAVQAAVGSENLIENVKIMGDCLGIKLENALSNLNFVGDIRGRGLFWAVEFVANKTTKSPFSEERLMGPLVVEAAFEQGLSIQLGICNTGAERVDCVIISPPYNVKRHEVSQIVHMLKQAIVQVSGRQQVISQHILL